MGDVLDNAMNRGQDRLKQILMINKDSRVHSPDKKNFIFVIHSHDDEEFGLATIKVRPQGIFGGHEIIRITCGSGISHLGELFDIALSTRDNMGWNGHVQNQIPVL